MGDIKQLRCNNCGKRLFDYDIDKGKVEIKCPRCGEFNKIIKE